MGLLKLVGLALGLCAAWCFLVIGYCHFRGEEKPRSFMATWWGEITIHPPEPEYPGSDGRPMEA